MIFELTCIKYSLFRALVSVLSLYDLFNCCSTFGVGIICCTWDIPYKAMGDHNYGKMGFQLVTASVGHWVV